jgi:hypothetical protein
MSHIENARRKKNEHTCRTCRFYDFFDKKDFDLEALCRRHPPAPMVGSNEDRNRLLYANWPLVSSNDWCGEWKPDFLDDPA